MPQPPTLLAQQAEHVANEVTGLQVSLKMTTLHEKYQQYMQHLRALPLTGPFEPKHHASLRYIARLDWWQHVHEGPAALPAPVAKQLKHVSKLQITDNKATLHRYFARTTR